MAIQVFSCNPRLCCGHHLRAPREREMYSEELLITVYFSLLQACLVFFTKLSLTALYGLQWTEAA